MPPRRTALLVRCSKKEAHVIRDAAKLERRTLSGFILHAVLNRIAHQHRLEAEWPKLAKGAAAL